LHSALQEVNSVILPVYLEGARRVAGKGLAQPFKIFLFSLNKQNLKFGDYLHLKILKQNLITF